MWRVTFSVRLSGQDQSLILMPSVAFSPSLNSPAHENQLGFIQGLGARALREVVREDFFGGLGPFVSTGDFTDRWAEHFRRNAQVRVPVEEKMGQVFESGEGVGNDADLVVG